MQPLIEDLAMRLRSWFLGFAVLCMATLSFAQYRSTPPLGEPSEYLRGQSTLGLRSLRGILDPTRMHMSQSFSIGYMNSGGRSASQGLYMNNLQYQLSQRLFLTTHLGYSFQPTGPKEWNTGLNNGDFVGGAELNWRPTSNTILHVSVARGMYSDSYYDGYGWGSYNYRPYSDRP
jgi:hypothetical protein